MSKNGFERVVNFLDSSTWVFTLGEFPVGWYPSRHETFVCRETVYDLVSGKRVEIAAYLARVEYEAKVVNLTGEGIGRICSYRDYEGRRHYVPTVFRGSIELWKRELARGRIGCYTPLSNRGVN